MSSVAIPAKPVAGTPRTTPAWLLSGQLWAGVSIVAIWLAVLFIGIFGGDIVSNSASGNTVLPVVLPIAVFAFLATIPVARWGFGAPRRALHDLRTEVEAERRAREGLAAEVAELRAATGPSGT